MDFREAYRELELTCLKIECPQCRALCLDAVHSFATVYCLINDCELVFVPALERFIELGKQTLEDKRKRVVLEE